MGIVLRGSDVVKRSHIMRYLETSARLQTTGTRHDGLQAAQVTQGAASLRAPVAMSIATGDAITWGDMDEDGALMEPYLG